MKHTIWLGLICFVLLNRPTVGSLDYEILWKVESHLGFSGPNEIQDTKTGRTIGIVACEVGKGIACFDMQGQRLWDYPLSPQITAYPAVADVDGDGHEDIVACGGSGELVALDNKGNLIWFAQTTAAVNAESCPAIADLDNDGDPEILIGDTGGYLSCFNHKGHPMWQFRGDGSQMGPVLVADIYQVPGKEIIVTSHDNHIYALSAKGEWLWDIYQEDDLFPNSTPLLADVDGDLRPELYIGGGLHHFYRIDLEHAKIEIKENTLLHVNSAIAANDIDSDGKDEVIFGNKGGVARCYDETGFIWKQEFQNGNMSFSPIIVNLDNDKDLEILFLFGIIHALDTDGKILQDKKLPGAINSPPLAGDFNNDGKLETIVAGYSLHGQHQIACFSWNVPYKKSNNDWTVFTGSRSHAGFNYFKESYSKYQLPAMAREISAEKYTSTENLQILSGKNIWRFDIKNPIQKRLVLLSKIRYPDGPIIHFANHVHAQNQRISIPFHIDKSGNYELSQQLIDANKHIILAAQQQTIGYQGLVGDKKYLTSLFGEIEKFIHLWKKTNPMVANGIQHQLVLLKGALNVLGEENTKNLSQIIESTRRLLSLTKAGRSLAPTGSFIAWEFCPWAYFDAKETVPTEKDKLKLLRVNLCQGEYESIALNVTNLSLENQELRVIPPDIKMEPKLSSSEFIQYRRAVKVPTVISDQIYDALPQLDEARLFSIPPLETEQLWITINAKNLTTGEYKTAIKLKNLQPVATEVIIPIHIKVYDLKLPKPRPLRFCVWAYAADWPEYELRDLIDHGVTIHFGIAPNATCNAAGVIEGEINFTQHDASVKRLAQHGFLLFLSPQSRLKGQPFLSEPWKNAFIQYLREWIAHMKKLGLNYDDWALYPYDEPSTPHAHATVNLVEVAKLVREADPNILIYTDPTSGTDEKTLEMLKGLIDIWCPSSELLERFGDTIIPFAKKHGKEVWFYDAAGKSKTLSPLGIYRWRFWYAWNMGFTGAGWWTYSYGDYDWDGPNEIGDYWATIYKSPGAIVTSKRWEVSREGLEDYEILFLLRKSIHKAKELGFEGVELIEASTVLRELSKSIEQMLVGTGRRIPLNIDGVPHYSQVTEEVQKARKQIIEACIRLNKAIE